MEFRHQDLTILGSFNTAILKPSWFKEKKIYEGQISTEIDVRNNSIRYFFEQNKIYMLPSITKLTIFPKIHTKANFNKRNLAFVGEIFEILKETPIEAVGFNFHSQVDPSAREEEKNILDIVSKYKFSVNSNIIPVSENFTKVFDVKDFRITLMIERLKNGDLFTSRINFEKNKTMGRFGTVKEFVIRIEEFQKYANDYL